MTQQTASSLASSTERTRRFRERARADGWIMLNIKVPLDKAEELKAFAKTLGEPVPKANPKQMPLFPDA